MICDPLRSILTNAPNNYRTRKETDEPNTAIPLQFHAWEYAILYNSLPAHPLKVKGMDICSDVPLPWKINKTVENVELCMLPLTDASIDDGRGSIRQNGQLNTHTRAELPSVSRSTKADENNSEREAQHRQNWPRLAK